jgi:hypothetical protein
MNREKNREVPSTRDNTNKNAAFGFKPSATNGNSFFNLESNPNKQLSTNFFGNKTSSGQNGNLSKLTGGFFNQTNSLGGNQLQSRKEVKQVAANAKQTDPARLIPLPNGKPSINRPEALPMPGLKLIEFQDDVMTYLAHDADKFTVKAVPEASKKLLVKSLHILLGIARSLKLRRESTLLAVYMMHRIASVKGEAEALPSFVIPALMIGGKTEEYFAPSIKDLLLTMHNTDAYRELKLPVENNPRVIKMMEAEILSQVAYNTIHPPVLDIVNIFASELGLPRDWLVSIQYNLIYDLVLVPDLFTYSMIQIACACLLIVSDKEKENHRISESRSMRSKLEERLEGLLEDKYSYKMNWKKPRALVQAYYDR